MYFKWDGHTAHVPDDNCHEHQWASRTSTPLCLRLDTNAMCEHALKYEFPACSFRLLGKYVFPFSLLSAVLLFSATINLNITLQQHGKWICMRAITGHTWKPRSGMMGEKRYALSSDIISCFRHSLTSCSFRRRKDYSLRIKHFLQSHSRKRLLIELYLHEKPEKVQQLLYKWMFFDRSSTLQYTQQEVHQHILH